MLTKAQNDLYNEILNTKEQTGLQTVRIRDHKKDLAALVKEDLIMICNTEDRYTEVEPKPIEEAVIEETEQPVKKTRRKIQNNIKLTHHDRDILKVLRNGYEGENTETRLLPIMRSKRSLQKLEEAGFIHYHYKFMPVTPEKKGDPTEEIWSVKYSLI